MLEIRLGCRSTIPSTNVGLSGQFVDRRGCFGDRRLSERLVESLFGTQPTTTDDTGGTT